MVEARLKQHAARVETALEQLLPSPDAEIGMRSLHEAMRYACLGGGKRLRAFLVLESAALFDVEPGHAEAQDQNQALRVAASVECLHAYSLVHDDLPCMDDDDLRRGKPTVHRAYDEATAVLAGDALQALAFEILADPLTHPDPLRRCALIAALARSSGAAGMVAGQAIDLAAEDAQIALDERQIRRLQALKTGALFDFSATAGGLLCGASEAELTCLSRYADAIGLAFQITDDLLDTGGEQAQTGKRVGKDRAAGKATFVGLWGEEPARRAAEDLVASAKEALAIFGARARNMADAADFVLTRRS
ncbi:MAG: polyprenyl synthetase family protein [Neomegalonema sp.]|nr:polyprenyl synthetase family protein [Neomegalonema sp.]